MNSCERVGVFTPATYGHAWLAATICDMAANNCWDQPTLQDCKRVHGPQLKAGE